MGIQKYVEDINMNTNDVLTKLIAEIERRINSWSICGKNSPVGQGKDTCESRVTELSDLLSFITSFQQEQPEVFDTMAFQEGVKEGKRLAIETIQSRIDEILGDAQPAPILRAELQELIKKIEQ